ncbi:MAG: YegP family protein [Christensenellaceae bacterium]
MNIFNEIIEYYRNEPNLGKYTLIVAALCLIVAGMIIFTKAALNKKRADDEEKRILSTMKDAEKIENFDDVQNIEPKNDNGISITLNDETTAVQSPEQTDGNSSEKTNEPEAVKTEEKPEETRYAGKWLIKKENGRFLAELTASNGEILLRTENYSALSGIKSGIETVKNNIAKDNIAISLDKNGNFFFKVYSSATRLLCISEGYSTKSSCERAIESVKRFSKTAVIVREQQQEEQA